MDSISYVYISWTIRGMWMIYITFERGGPKFSNTTATTPLAPGCSTFSEWISTSTMDRSRRERRPGASVLAPEISWSHTLRFFLWGLVKEAVYVPSLPTSLDDLKKRTTTAVNSVTQDILLWVWNEFSYRVDVTRAAGGGGGTLNIYKLHCEYNQMQFTSYLSLVLILKYRLTKLSPYFWITLYCIIIL